ncbi:MAG: SAM-dependent methyltransferase, partial [Candidatus Binatia bacterium]
IRDRDEARADELVRLALDVATRCLRPAGGFICKVFMSAAYRNFLAEVKQSFEEVVATRPESTRKGSSELYLVARGFRRR